MVGIRPDEISSILKEQLSNTKTQAQLEEVGTVLQVGDGVARIYGLTKAQSGELIEFQNGLKALVLNLEEDNVGAVILGETANIKEGDTVKVGDIVCKIDTSVAPSPKAEKTETAAPTAKVVESAKASPAPTPVTDSKNDSYAKGTPAPAAKKLMEENKIPANVISGTGKDGRITKGDVLDLMAKDLTYIRRAI